VLVALGLPRTGRLQALLRPLIWPPAHRFATFAAELDRRAALDGATAAARWALSLFTEDTRALGTEFIPASGPLLVASNHPGSYDSLLIIASLAREDLKIFVSDVPFLRKLVGCSPYFLHTPGDPHARMAALRAGIQHLRAGGALLVFATGVVDPDPALRPGAREALQGWSASLPLLVRQAPETATLVTLVSGVVAPACFHHPLTRLRREPPMKQFLAEFLQISQQVLFHRRFPLTPTVRFALPLTAAELGHGRDPQAALATLIGRAESLLEEVDTAGS
jgi:hypothetical protein